MRCSRPSLARQLAAGIIMAVGAGYVATVKLTRNGETALTTAWLAGVLPNLVCATVVPLAPFISRRSLRVSDFLSMTLFTAMLLCVYEIAQMWMPRRTFDLDDIWATAAGAIASLGLGTGFFLLTGGKTAEPTYAPSASNQKQIEHPPS